MKRILPTLYGLTVFLVPLIVDAQTKKGKGGGQFEAAKEVVTGHSGSESFANRPIVLILALAALSLVPFVLMMVTSFVKISVVLSIVRSALGTQQIPPTQVITGLAIILTVYIMAPVGQQMMKAAQIDQFEGGAVFSSSTVGQMITAANNAKEPLRQFLLKKVTPKDNALFYNLALKMRKTPEEKASISKDDFMILTPAFVVSELKEAFQIGFILFVPFIVIDMVVANILLALGMHMLSPTTISMPFKLLLFVLVDGWYLIAKGLVVGYL